jgi:hypothetical protein
MRRVHCFSLALVQDWLHGSDENVHKIVFIVAGLSLCRNVSPYVDSTSSRSATPKYLATALIAGSYTPTHINIPRIRSPNNRHLRKKIHFFSSCQGLLLECTLCSRTLIILVPENVIVLACENHVGPRFRRSLANVQPSEFRKNCNSTQLVEWIELVADLHVGQLSSD